MTTSSTFLERIFTQLVFLNQRIAISTSKPGVLAFSAKEILEGGKGLVNASHVLGFCGVEELKIGIED